MENSIDKIVFGPVPSRRLGISLGVNNVFSKYCSYSCVYCQVGRTDHLTITRRQFYEPRLVVEKVTDAYKLHRPDVITFVPNGEPTLDKNLGIETEEIKNNTKAKLAILSNSSLIFREDVREDLKKFDIVSLKIDTVIEETWKKLNRPHPELRLDKILGGMIQFSKEYNGNLIMETMLVSGLNDNENEYLEIANFLRQMKFNKIYIMIPIRPPAEKWVKKPSEEKVLVAYSMYSKILGKEKVELLISPESSDFKFADELVKDIAKTVYVHPLRISHVVKLAEDKGVSVQDLLSKLEKVGVIMIEYEGEKFLVPKTRK